MHEVVSHKSPNNLLSGLDGFSDLLLMLDYDGTLAPFVDGHNRRAYPHPQVRQLINDLLDSPGITPVIVSGRDLESLQRNLGLDEYPELWGCHGWQRRLPDGSTRSWQLSRSQSRTFDRAEQLAEEIGLPECFERKPFGAAFHWRGLDSDTAERIQSAAREFCNNEVDEEDFEIHDADCVIELTPRGRDKGSAVQKLRNDHAPDRVIYLGDSRTDEDAFRALGEEELGVLVREDYRETRADVWIQPPEQLYLLSHIERSARSGSYAPSR